MSLSVSNKALSEQKKVEIGANIEINVVKWQALLKFCRETESNFGHTHLWGVIKKDFCNEKKWSRLTKSDNTQRMQLSRGWAYHPKGYKTYQFFELFEQIAIEFQESDEMESVDVNRKYMKLKT